MKELFDVLKESLTSNATLKAIDIINDEITTSAYTVLAEDEYDIISYCGNASAYVISVGDDPRYRMPSIELCFNDNDDQVFYYESGHIAIVNEATDEAILLELK